jgi:hypothetical protein
MEEHVSRESPTLFAARLYLQIFHLLAEGHEDRRHALPLSHRLLTPNNSFRNPTSATYMGEWTIQR